MKTGFRTLIITAMFCAALGTASYADGWTKDGEWWLYLENGVPVCNQWKSTSEGYYYLGSNGRMVTDSFVDDNRYVGSDGKMVTSAWRFLNNEWYYFDGNGKITENATRTINDKSYYFGDRGALRTGWIEDGDSWRYADPQTGALCVSLWKKLPPAEDMNIQINNNDPVTAESDGTYWFYFMSTGKVCNATSGEFRDNLINQQHYAFDQNGIMQTGWVDINENVASDAPEIARYRYYNDNNKIGPFGAAHTGWLSTYPPARDGFGTDVSWYYFDSTGKPAYGKDLTDNDTEETLEARLRVISGKKYLFNKWGNPVYGLRRVRKNDGTVTSMYFGTRNECCLQYNEKNITDAENNTRQYCFDASGYGVNGPKKVSGSMKLYYMGLLQRAQGDNYQYYTIKDVTYLVNKSGQLVKNHHSDDYESDANGVKPGDVLYDAVPEEPVFDVSDM